jgi:hypothetical protein
MELFRGFRDKRRVLIRYFGDAASEILGMPPCTRGAGDAGVLKWRSENKGNWKKVLLKKPEELVFNPDMTTACAIVYGRLIKNMSTKFFQLPQDMTLEFEAFGLIVLMVTWFTPAAQHSEGTCGSKGYIDMLENVRKQREILASGAASQPPGDIEEEGEDEIEA